MLTPTSSNSTEVPFPYPPDNDATVLHPRVQTKLDVAKHMERLKMSLPSGSKETGLQILEKMAAGDDGWLNSPIRNEEHLETPQWLKDLQKMSIKEPPQIDEEQLQKVKEGVDKIQPSGISNEHNEGSLLSTEYIESLMPLPSSTVEMPPEAPAQQIEAIIETPTTFMATIAPTTIQENFPMPVQPDPITPIPPALQPVLQKDSTPPSFKTETTQERNSDAVKLNTSSFYMPGASPLLLTLGGICDHMSKNSGKVPLCINASRRLYPLLSEDIKNTIGVDFYGHVPFHTAKGTAFIPVRISENMGISIHAIECIS